MNVTGALQQIRREIVGLPYVTAAGLTPAKTHFCYIDEVQNPALPSLTVTASGQQDIPQANIWTLQVTIGIYTKDANTTRGIVEAIMDIFSEGMYSFAGDDFTIFSADISPQMFLLTPEYNTTLRAWEGVVPLVVSIG